MILELLEHIMIHTVALSLAQLRLQVLNGEEK